MAKWQASRVDSNQPELVEYIRGHGATFQHTHTVPGALDGIIGFHGIDQRVEIKDPTQPKKKHLLTEMEVETFDTWKGRKPVVIFTREDCKLVLKRLMKEAIARNKLEL